MFLVILIKSASVIISQVRLGKKAEKREIAEYNLSDAFGKIMDSLFMLL